MSEAASRDAAPIAALHAASFRRGWSEQEVEGLLTDRHVIAHRAMTRIGQWPASSCRGWSRTRRKSSRSRSPGSGAAAGWRATCSHLHLRRLAALGARAVFLEVDEHNAAAIRLYDRAGFREISRRPNYYPGPGGKAAAALVLRRDLV